MKRRCSKNAVEGDVDDDEWKKTMSEWLIWQETGVFNSVVTC